MPQNPKLFRELSEPFASHDAANAAIEAFFKDVGEIREKHRITNVHCILAGSQVDESGEEAEWMTSFHYGDALRAQAMTAWSYGKETADHDKLIREITARAMRRAKT